MPGRPRRRSKIRLALALAVAPTIIASTAQAATYVFTNPLGGRLDISANYTPSGIPGTADTFRLNALPTIPGFLTLRVASNQTIGRLEFNHFAPNTISADSSGGVPYTLTLSTGQIALLDSIGEAPEIPLDTLFINAPLAGGAGLNKSGQGFAFLSATNVYTNGTTITGTGISGGGGLSVATDAALGSGGVTLTAGGTLRTVSSITTIRTFTVGTGGGRIENFGTLTLNGQVTGSGTLTIGRFTGGTTIANAAINSFNGGLVIANGNTFRVSGQFGAATAVVGGTLDLDDGATGVNSPVLQITTPISSLGGTITMAGGASASSFGTFGTLTLASGTTTLNLEPTIGGGANLSFSSLSRVNRSTMFVRGRDLGTASAGANLATIKFGDTTNLPLVGGNGSTGTNDGIVPFLFGNKNVVGGTSQLSAVEAGFVTRNANGLAPLDGSRYATSLGANAQDNVRLSNNVFTQNAAATMNSLIVRDTQASNGNSGVTGSGMLTINSGAILAVSDLAGEELFIDNPINFGSAEGVVHTAPTSDGFSQLTLRGAISGNNGLTKSAAGELFLENTASTFLGPTTIDAGTITYSGNVAVNTPGALGSSNADVVINAGVTGTQYVGLRPATAGSSFSRNIVVHQDVNANSLAFIGTYGGYGSTFGGQITVDGGFLNLLGDTEPEVLTFNGQIVGAGGLQEPGTATPQLQYLRLNGSNSYTGGTVIRAGRWDVGSNTALGAGTVYFVGNNDDATTQTGAIQASGGVRTLGNALVLRATPVFSGTNALTLSGAIDLGSVPREVNVTATADVTMSGVVGRGGITKTGSGRLVLSGPNTFNGQSIVSAGILRAASSAALGESTGPADPGTATFITGTGQLELVGNITNSESIYFGSGAQAITAAITTGNLRNFSGNNTIDGQIAYDNVATVGVDGGSTLTLSGDGVDGTAAANATLRKVGAGTLIVRNVRLPSLAINAGTLRLNQSGAPFGTSRVGTLTIDAGGVFDVTNNAVVYDYATTSPLTSVRSLLANGRITTSVTQAGARVGYAEASTIFTASSFPQSFYGQVIDNTTVVLLQTLGGDANLDRVVAFDDLVTLAQNYLLTNRVWTSGDFDYNGTVDFNDLVILSQNYGMTATGALTANDVAAAFGSEFASEWALAQAMVPEPSAFVMLALLTPWIRRRK